MTDMPLTAEWILSKDHCKVSKIDYSDEFDDAVPIVSHSKNGPRRPGTSAPIESLSRNPFSLRTRMHKEFTEPPPLVRMWLGAMLTQPR